MTAHILYTAWDDRHPATLSPRVLRVIRRRLGFRGPILSDDLAMKALCGSPGALARAAIAAGCDAVLECPGELARSEAVLAATPPVSRASAARFAAAARRAAAPSRFDRARAEAALAALGA
ncbi:MAG: glycoside hydrolase family 3 N-terminal domain-containing protein [Acetobacteraceae bacterium]|nr:glycoside hydrolase family 3 N-terminal domain-containing protein [Acetobacteraceae bacterium]